MNLLFSLILTINSLSLSMILFLYKNNEFIFYTTFFIEDKTLFSIGVVVVVIVLLHIFENYIVSLDDDEIIEEGSIEGVDYANYQFLPSFLAYFFIAMNVGTWGTYLFIFTLLTLFFYRTKLFYFNPIYILLGYNFFYLTYKDKSKILVITKDEVKKPKDISFNHLKRINNYTFFDAER